MLFSEDCFLDWLEHISAFGTELRFVEVVIFERFYSSPFLFQSYVSI